MGVWSDKRAVDPEWVRCKLIVSKINAVERGYIEDIRRISAKSASYYIMRDVLDEAEYLREEGEVMADLEPLIKKGRGDGKKVHTYQIRVTEPEFKAVKELAKFFDLSVSEWIAYMIIYRKDLLFSEREKERRKRMKPWEGTY